MKAKLHLKDMFCPAGYDQLQFAAGRSKVRKSIDGRASASYPGGACFLGLGPCEKDVTIPTGYSRRTSSMEGSNPTVLKGKRTTEYCSSHHENINSTKSHYSDNNINALITYLYRKIPNPRSGFHVDFEM